MASYKGVKRRFTYQIKTEKLVFIDDYAHHPEEINAVFQAVRELYPEKEIMVIFQPHLYSRTKDQCDGFVETLDKADEVILLPIYPARELPMEGVSSEMLLAKMKLSHKKIMSKDELFDWAANSQDKLIVMAGAGDIDTCILKVQEILTNK